MRRARYGDRSYYHFEDEANAPMYELEKQAYAPGVRARERGDAPVDEPEKAARASIWVLQRTMRRKLQSYLEDSQKAANGAKEPSSYPPELPLFVVGTVRRLQTRHSLADMVLCSA